jgi:hypothetical protein
VPYPCCICAISTVSIYGYISDAYPGISILDMYKIPVQQVFCKYLCCNRVFDIDTDEQVYITFNISIPYEFCGRFNFSIVNIKEMRLERRYNKKKRESLYLQP